MQQPFIPDATLSFYRGWEMDVGCPRCRVLTSHYLRDLMPRHARLRLGDLASKLRCRRCGSRPDSIRLVEFRSRHAPGQRPRGGGGAGPRSAARRGPRHPAGGAGGSAVSGAQREAIGGLFDPVHDRADVAQEGRALDRAHHHDAAPVERVHLASCQIQIASRSSARVIAGLEMFNSADKPRTVCGPSSR